MRDFFDKYFHYVRVGFLTHVQYRVDILIFRLVDLVRFVTLIYLWTNIYESTQTIAGFSLREMIGYYIGVMILSEIVEPKYKANALQRDIEEGKLSFVLVKPVNYLLGWYCESLGSKLIHALFSFAVIFPVAYLLGYLTLPSPGYFVMFWVSLLLGQALSFCWMSLINSMAFWTIEVHGIRFLANQVIGEIFKGSMVPLSLFPVWTLGIIRILPFGYFFYFPLMIFMQKISWHQVWLGLGVQLVWCLSFVILLKYIWSRGLRRYEAVGG